MLSVVIVLWLILKRRSLFRLRGVEWRPGPNRGAKQTTKHLRIVDVLAEMVTEVLSDPYCQTKKFSVVMFVSLSFHPFHRRLVQK
jgi:hypothetical protein